VRFARGDLAQVQGADGAVLDGDLVGLPRTVVGDGEAVLGHRGCGRDPRDASTASAGASNLGPRLRHTGARAKRVPRRRMDAGRSRTYPLLLGLFFLSGTCGLVYQVVWLRTLSLVFGTTTFAVSAVISSFMAGLGLGSYLSGRHLAGRGRALRLFGAMEIGVGLYALLLPWLLASVERSFTHAVAGLGLTVYGESVLKLALSFVVLLLPTSLMGATLPLLAEHTVERFGHLGTRVGRLYALNTLGAAVGCFVAGFAAIPALGVTGTTWATASLNFTVGALAITLAGGAPLSERSAPLGHRGLRGLGVCRPGPRGGVDAAHHAHLHGHDVRVHDH